MQQQEEIPKELRVPLVQGFGFLAQLLSFEHEGKYFWTTCSNTSRQRQQVLQ